MSLSRWAFIIGTAIIAVAVLGIWLGEPWAGVWRWPTLVVLMLLVWERLRLPPSLVISRHIPKTVALGEPVNYTLSVANPSARVLQIETQADYPTALVADNALQAWRVAADEQQSRVFSITPTQLGAAALGSLYVRQLGGFGLCWWTRPLTEAVAFTVEPVRLTAHANLAGRRDAGNRYSRQPHSSGVELLELRDYRQGDSLRSMDWKATARRGKPIVRSFTREHRLEMVVVVDCGRGSRLQCGRLGRLQHSVNVAAKLSEFAALQGDRIACLVYAQQPLGQTPLAGGWAAVKQVRQLLGQAAATNETSNALNAALAVKQLLKRRGLVVFLTEIEQPGAAAQLLQAAQLLAGKHQVLVASLDDPTISAALSLPARHWQDPYRHFATLEYQRGRALTRQQLQRTGVAIISAVPEQLDQQILAYYQNHRERIGGA